ncbi:hypothetical protein EK21DRAFT_97703 [Setomelanomma holmii]|uniref:Heterokaryon incompatibility domain-containing protein n=1 Tax=Setomelanomma holmii TaxID=210430 RepID=A0A9P4HJQ5_9PLEO|nr:hypothetical protein EK21DRAFT_97703 [Setomelanomma holmii]
MAPWPRFSHEALPPRHIRIFEVQPGDSSDVFRGRFILASIDSEVECDALSYMWGAPAPVDKIIVAGAAIPLASNLATALRHIRNCKEPEPLKIWIDAICINQDDSVERGHQVAMMRLVYSKARCVRIWINEPEVDKNSIAVAALHGFHLASKPDYGLGIDPGFWAPVLPIFFNNYWSRIWIQQEVLNAQKLIMQCKGIIVPGGSIAHFQEALWGIFVDRQELSLWRKFFFQSSSKYDPHLSPAAAKLHDRHISRIQLGSQDRVYAIMHLASDYEEGGIVVDYTKPLMEVMIDVAVYHNIQHRNFDFLHASRLESTKVVGSGAQDQLLAPTWIPECWLRHEFIFSPYSPFNTPERRLALRGIQIDTVRQDLTCSPGIKKSTVAQFWSSDVGIYLLKQAVTNWKDLPREVIRVMGYLSVRGYQHEDLQAGLQHLFELHQSGMHAHRVLDSQAEDFHDLLTSAAPAAQLVLREFFRYLFLYSLILTGSGCLGSAPRCDIQEGDESSMPGAEVGQWTVQDIELE